MTLAGGSDAQVRVVDDAAALARAGAALVVQAARQAVAGRGRFSIALSGGSTPRALYALLASPPYRDEMPWEAVEVFWGDERCVPPDDAQSNYRMAREALLDHVSIPPLRIHRLHGEDDPRAAASAYEAELRQVFSLGPGALPQLDLVLLGMGPDGHTASLFPDTDAAAITDRLVAAPYVPHLHDHRLTLTLPVLNAARHVAFMVAGADKQETLGAVWQAGASGNRRLPSSLVHPSQGTLTWLVDRAAAGSTAPR